MSQLDTKNPPLPPLPSKVEDAKPMKPPVAVPPETETKVFAVFVPEAPKSDAKPDAKPETKAETKKEESSGLGWVLAGVAALFLFRRSSS